jgi:disulfide oxidoreductase YuzD
MNKEFTLLDLMEQEFVGRVIRVTNRSFIEPKFLVKMVRITSKGNIEVWGECVENVITDAYMFAKGMVDDRLITQTTKFEFCNTFEVIE